MNTTELTETINALTDQAELFADPRLASGLMVLMFILVFVDLVLKGWGMWRAAKMDKKVWFFGLLVVNSLGIMPAIFLLLTKNEYRNRMKK